MSKPQSLPPLRRLQTLGIAMACTLGVSAHAQTIKTWQAGAGDFFGAANWSPAGAPGAMEIGLINNGGTATIALGAGSAGFGGIRLGDTQDAQVSGNVIMNSGTLMIGNNAGDPKAVIGFSAQLSTFIMNGGTILFDGPDMPGLTHGVNELDWEVGERGMGRFEMHNDAVFRAGDDLKIAENAAGNGYCLIDGNARVSVGSGISISSGGTVEQTMIVGGNALVESGNSMGAGDPNGYTDEGYLTLSIGGGRAKLVLQDNAVMNIRVLSSRVGTTRMTVKDNAQFHIFDVLTGKGYINSTTPPDRPEIVGGFNSTLSSESPADSILTLQDHAQMTVNASAGLGISAPRASGSAVGGKAQLIVRDHASLRIEQQLALGTGTQAATSDGTLEVVGPNAMVSIGGNLNLAVDPDGNVPTTDWTDALGNPTPGKGTLSVVITGPTHAVVNVDGTARIAKGILKIKTDGFTPAAGATYTVLKAHGTPALDGEFAKVHVGGAAAPAGHTWAVEYTADSVIVKVVPGIGRPQESGLAAVSDTFYVNTPPAINNDSTESLGVAIAANNNVAIGWEDDGDGILDTEAVWTLYDSTGKSITPDTLCTSTVLGESVTSKHLSYFRSDGSAVYGGSAWGPKIKSNLFGDGMGMGAVSYDLSREVPEFAAWDDANMGDIPSVQLLDNTGAPVRILTGVTAEYATSNGGNIRIADWEYLSNGNILIVGESRQGDDLINLYGGDTAANHVMFRILTPSGTVVKSETLAGELPVKTEAWHGAAVVQDGFAIRMATPEGVAVRLFDNAGTPKTGNLVLNTLAGNAAAGGGGRGDSAGFHGNGKDAYVAVCGSGSVVQVTVINADGTLRYSKSVIDDVTINGNVGRADAAISPSGQIVVVFSAKVVGGPVDENGADVTTVLGRLLDAQGNALGNTFFVSDNEMPLMKPGASDGPRVAWRGDLIAVTWESLNSGVLADLDGDTLFAPVNTVAARLLKLPSASTPVNISGITDNGATVTIAWTGGSAPYTVLRKASLSDAMWSNVQTTSDTQVTLPKEGASGYFRIQD